MELRKRRRREEEEEEDSWRMGSPTIREMVFVFGPTTTLRQQRSKTVYDMSSGVY